MSTEEFHYFEVRVRVKSSDDRRTHDVYIQHVPIEWMKRENPDMVQNIIATVNQIGKPVLANREPTI